jgi:hypothetical protein
MESELITRTEVIEQKVDYAEITITKEEVEKLILDSITKAFNFQDIHTKLKDIKWIIASTSIRDEEGKGILGYNSEIKKCVIQIKV